MWPTRLPTLVPTFFWSALPPLPAGAVREALTQQQEITWEDYEYVRDNMRLAEAVGLETHRNGKVKYKTESIEDIDVRGVTANMAGIDAEEPVLGRYISDADDLHRANVTMIGNDVAKRFFAGIDPLGKSVYIDGEAYEVMGVAKEMGSAFGQSQDSFTYIPIQTGAKCTAATRQ